MVKKRPRIEKRKPVSTDTAAPSKMEVGYWQRRLYKNTFTYKGKRQQVTGWSVKIQLFGKRKTFSLGSSLRPAAAAEACHIYQTIQTQGWETVGSRRARTNFQSQLLQTGNVASGIEFDSEYWKRRLIQRKYPEQPKAEEPREFSARFEHAGISRYFPLGTSDENSASEAAIKIHQTIVQQGWAVANQKFSRELTIAMRWLDDPLAWTYTTLHTFKSDERKSHKSTSTPNPDARRCAVIEPDAGIRLALTTAINSQDGFSCEEGYANAAEAEREITRHRIDFVTINYSLPDQPGAACLVKLQQIKPGVAGLLHSVYEDSDELFKTTPGGAAGYLLKRTPSYRIFDPIAEAPTPLTREVIATRIRDYFQRLIAAMPSGFVAVEIAKLTPREQEILALLARGYVAKEIADTLGISIWTVHGHIKSIFEKLGVHTRTEAVVKFLQK